MIRTCKIKTPDELTTIDGLDLGTAQRPQDTFRHGKCLTQNEITRMEWIELIITKKILLVKKKCLFWST